MKKLTAVLLALGLGASLAACGGGASSAGASSAGGSSAAASSTAASSAPAKTESASKTETPSAEASGDIKVGIALPTRDQYWTTFELGAVATAEAEGIENQVVECKEDIQTQLGQIETFKNNGFDAVIVGLASNDSYQEAINAAGDMKVIFFNRMVTDTSCLDGKNVIYVGMAEYDAGYAQGLWLADYFAEQGKKDLKGMMFMGILGQQSVTDRTQGAKDALADNGFNVEWVFEDTAEWDRTKAMDKFTQFAGTGADFDFVCSNNDEMALGVIEGCSASGIDIDFPIVGIDATETGCGAIKDGTMKMTVNQNPTLQGEICIECVEDLLAGQTPAGCDDKFIYATEAQAITADNVDEVLALF